MIITNRLLWEPMLNIYTLHYFYVTAQHLNFSKAAKHLYITQPALSKQIQQLEDQLQVKLFDRTKRSVKLTDAGLVLLDHCRNIFQDISNLETAMDQFRKEVRGSLRIASTPSLGNYLLPDFLKSFSTQFPQIMLHTIFKPIDDVVYMLKTGELDFGLLNTDETFEGLDTKSMGGQPLIFICSKNCEHECSVQQRESMPVESLEKCRFISFSKQSQIRQAVDGLVRDHKLQLDTVIESENIEIIKSMVIRGMGGSIVPECAVRNEIKEKLVTVKPLEGITLTKPVNLYYRSDLHLSKAHQEFLNIFKLFCKGEDIKGSPRSTAKNGASRKAAV